MYFTWSLYIFIFFLMAISKKTTDTVAPAADITLPAADTTLPAADHVSQWPSDNTTPSIDLSWVSWTEIHALTPEEPSQESNGALSIEEIAANQAAADAAFKAANDGAEERIAKEEAIPSMTADELQAEFGWTVPEAISVLRDALSRSGSIHLDKMNDLLDKIEQTSAL